MVQQIVGLAKELQEARDSEEEARLLRRKRVQMFREVSTRIMEVAQRLGIEGLSLHPAPENDGAILRFIDAECREILGLAGTRIFSNL
jgi:hypothetical protein